MNVEWSWAVGSVVALLGGIVIPWVRHRMRQSMAERTAVAFQNIRVQLADTLGDATKWESLVSTSPAHSLSGGVPHEMAIRELRAQVDRISEEVKRKESEIVEVHKIDPVLEATLKGSIDNLTKRIEALEKNLLSKWDVATVVLQLVGGVGVILGIVFGIIKSLS